MLLLFDLCDVVSGGSQHFCMTIPFFLESYVESFFFMEVIYGIGGTSL